MPFDGPILITGGGGFVGRYLVAELRRSMPARRRIVVSLIASAADVDGEDEWIRIDITDAQAIDSVIAEYRPATIVHLAAQSSVGLALEARFETWTVNFQGTFNLASAVARHTPAAAFLYVSSAEVYGGTFLGGMVTEESPLRPTNAYSRSKAAAEAMLHDILPADAQLVVVRPFNHTGPGQDERFVLPAFAAQIARIEAGLSEPVLTVGNLDVKRTFLDVRDVVHAYELILAAAESLPMRTVFNVASDRLERIETVLAMMAAEAKSPFEIVTDPGRSRPGEIPATAGSSTRLHRATGWVPRIPLETTIRHLLDFERARVAAPSGQDSKTRIPTP